MGDSLAEAIISGDREGLLHLLKSGINLNTHFYDGALPLNVAIANHNYFLARLLIDSGADINRSDSFRLDGCSRKPIHYAAACNSLEMTRYLVGRDVDPDERDSGNSTPLHHAAASGNLDIVEFLLSLGCDVDSMSNSGRSALWKAAINGHRDVTHYLLAMGAHVNTQSQVGSTVLFDCARKPELLGIATDLIHYGADVNVKDIEKNTALHGAACMGREEHVRLLIHAGVDVTWRNDSGNTALHTAAMYNHVSTCAHLLNHGADQHVTNRAGQSALYMSLLHQRNDASRLLHYVGAKVTAKDLSVYKMYESTRCRKKRIFYIWALQLFFTPLTLAQTCRRVIRNSLSVIPAIAIEKLPLPRKLQDFISLAEYSNVEE